MQFISTDVLEELQPPGRRFESCLSLYEPFSSKIVLVFYTEDEGSSFLRNVGKGLPGITSQKTLIFRTLNFNKIYQMVYETRGEVYLCQYIKQA
jgi:hypothetical protein